MTVDVEDYFQVQALPTASTALTGRTCHGASRRTSIASSAQFDRAGVHATFFTLGWVAERHPATGAPHRRRRA